jgi:hypothetical protein
VLQNFDILAFIMAEAGLSYKYIKIKVLSYHLAILWLSIIIKNNFIVWLGQGQAKAKPKLITQFTLNHPQPPPPPPTTTQTFEALPGKLSS